MYFSFGARGLQLTMSMGSKERRPRGADFHHEVITNMGMGNKNADSRRLRIENLPLGGNPGGH